MSKLQRHRKSQSTSALSVIADGGTPSGLGDRERRAKLRANQHPALGRVEEDSGVSPRLSGVGATVLDSPRMGEIIQRGRGELPGEKEKVKRTKSVGRGAGDEEVRGWMSDVSSLRSSERRRLAALTALEKTLFDCCTRPNSEGLTLSRLSSIHMHLPLIGLMTRHAQSLSSRHPPSGDELVEIVLELGGIVRLLQGLCLLSQACKESSGQQHVLEILIDLLLLLRTQPPPPPAVEAEEPHSIVYNILDLLCCVLVDSPANARVFERLSGLEGVVRVLKGTGVAKEIRMKCLEFLYFYLLPENSTQNRSVSAGSAASHSSSSSSESVLYPSSPLSSSTSSIGSCGRISPSPLPTSSHLQPLQHYTAETEGEDGRQFEDLDMPFIPQTPKKKPQPSLGYLTPSTRRVSGGSSFVASTTPSLAPVPASPHEMADSPRRMEKRDSSRDHSKSTEGVDKRRWSVIDVGSRSSDVRLGLGIPKSPSASTSLVEQAGGSAIKRDVTAIKTDRSFMDPFSDRSSSSGSSTVVPSAAYREPPKGGMGRSSTTSNLSDLASDTSREASSRTSSPHLSSRRSSVRRPSKLVQVSTPNSPDLPASTSTTATTTPIPSSSSSRLIPRDPKMRHSRTQSHLSSLSSLAPPLAPPPPIPPLPTSSSISSHAASPRRRSTPPSASNVPGPVPTPIPLTPKRSSSRETATPLPTPAKRAFPAELTRGIPPSVSSPSLVVPLGAARRIPSDKRGDLSVQSALGQSGKRGVRETEKEVRSVEEKKELLSSWLGNVDALVQGVEKVSFWSSAHKGGQA